MAHTVRPRLEARFGRKYPEAVASMQASWDWLALISGVDDPFGSMTDMVMFAGFHFENYFDATKQIGFG